MLKIKQQYSMPQARGVCSICGQDKADYKIEIDDKGTILVYRVHKACVWRAEEKALIKELMND